MSHPGDHASFPPLPPPTFPPPDLLDSKLLTGNVVVPLDDNNDDNDPKPDLPGPPQFERRKSVAGNILRIQGKDGTLHCFLMQRKIRNTLYGSIRVGYVVLAPQSEESFDYKVKLSESEDPKNPYEMVTIKIERKSANSRSQLGELWALQTIAAFDSEGKGHVEGSSIIGADAEQIYIVTPFYKDGSLYDYCSQQEDNRVSEVDARMIFRQLLQGLNTLKEVELCHRNISLESVYLNGKSCTISSLENAIRLPNEEGVVHMVEPQPLIGRAPQFFAPELLKEDAFDGFATDLWSVSVILLSLLFGGDALFSTPVPEDKVFKEICMKKNLKLISLKWQQKGSDGSSTISETALDLLQGLLNAEPKNRLMLSQVLQHPWVRNCEDGDAVK